MRMFLLKRPKENKMILFLAPSVILSSSSSKDFSLVVLILLEGFSTANLFHCLWFANLLRIMSKL